MKKNLKINEKIFYEAIISKKIRIFWLIITFFLTLLQLFVMQKFILFFIAFSLYMYFTHLIYFLTTKVLITRTRIIIIKKGIINIKMIEIPLKNIKTITTHYSPLGKWLKYGTIKIEGLGFKTINIKNIENYSKFKQTISKIIKKNNRNKFLKTLFKEISISLTSIIIEIVQNRLF